MHYQDMLGSFEGGVLMKCFWQDKKMDPQELKKYSHCLPPKKRGHFLFGIPIFWEFLLDWDFLCGTTTKKNGPLIFDPWIWPVISNLGFLPRIHLNGWAVGSTEPLKWRQGLYLVYKQLYTVYLLPNTGDYSDGQSLRTFFRKIFSKNSPDLEPFLF